MGSSEDRYEIAFFDVETTVPTRAGVKFAILEFGSILVCPRRLEELENYSTLVRPIDLSLISSLSVRCNGITREAVTAAPSFRDIADRVYDILHGRIWAGHNILRFDCARIREAYADIGRPAPEPKGTIDSLALLTQKFGRRAGDMKMATLATYFGLGQQTHRSLDDVRMNLEVLKYCATVLFLESSLPEILTTNSWISPNAITRSRSSNGKLSPEGTSSNVNLRPASLNNGNMQTLTSTNQMMIENHPISSLVAPNREAESNQPQQDPFNMAQLTTEIMLQCARLKVRFGISTKFIDLAGRPKLNFVVDAPPSLCTVLDSCNNIVQKMTVESESNSEWRPVVNRKFCPPNNPTIRLHIPTAVCGEIAIYATEIYQKESSGSVQRLVFSKFDAAELNSLLPPGTFVDAFFSLDPYDYQQNAGVRLVAKKLIIHSD
uniref:Exonuclease domain-containing protein n=1 Tax=Cannabis sativa TaxID=3483 RepID=A0A803Q757_CANSA